MVLFLFEIASVPRRRGEVKRDRNPERERRHEIFGRPDPCLEKHDASDDRHHEEICFQKMHRIDFTASEKKVHYAVENEGRKQDKPGRLQSVIRNVPAGRVENGKYRLKPTSDATTAYTPHNRRARIRTDDNPRTSIAF